MKRRLQRAENTHVRHSSKTSTKYLSPSAKACTKYLGRSTKIYTKYLGYSAKTCTKYLGCSAKTNTKHLGQRSPETHRKHHGHNAIRRLYMVKASAKNYTIKFRSDR